MAKKKPETVRDADTFFAVLKASSCRYSAGDIADLLQQVDEGRYRALATLFADYIGPNLRKAIQKKGGVAAYRTNPYVLMASASAMRLSAPERLADFIFNNKLYAGLETSFGKSIERHFVAQYPIGAAADARWSDPPEKVSEAAALAGLSREEKAIRRVNSVWREIDKACVFGDRRYLVSIKSGPNCINDTQVQGMADAISLRYPEWLRASKAGNPAIAGIDIVVGITYGTVRTTNNKENQILAKLFGNRSPSWE